MAADYTASQRELQERFDTRRLADRLAEGTSDGLGEAHARFVEARDSFFIATVDGDGFPQCSHKGGAPGFVRVLDERTLAFPVYDGNGMFLTAGNVLGPNPNVGLLFLDRQTGTRLRVNGEASIDPEDPLLGSFPHAVLVVRVRTRAVFANCTRYVHRYEQVEPSPFTPVEGVEPPVPDWKLHPWFEGTLPEGDPALDPDRPSAPAIPQYP